MNKKIVGIFVVIILVVMVVILNGKSNKLTGSIKMAAVFPFSGSSGITGESSRNGLQLAVDKLNSSGGINGRKIDIVYEDSQTKTDVGLSAYKKVKDIDKVNVVFSSVSGVALAISPLANKDEVVQMDVVSAAPAYSTPNDYTFRTGVNSYAFAKEMSSILKVKGIHKVGVLYVNTEFGTGYHKVFVENYEDMNNVISISESFNQGDTDFKTQLLKIKSSDIQALVLISLQKESPIILTQIGQLGIHYPIYTDVYAAELPDNLNVPSANGVIYIKPTISNNSEFSKFKDAYSQKYGKDPDFIAAQAYDGLRLVNIALQKCGGDRDTKCIKDALYSINNFAGVIGDNISFDINGDINNRAFDVMTIKDGKFVKLGE